MWECGLKLCYETGLLNASIVTPYVGVWIETVKLLDELDNYKVTPYVGVWIETFICGYEVGSISVTPYVGVWIETRIAPGYLCNVPSLLMWECGLKPLSL